MPRFPKSVRILKSREFDVLLKKGKSFGSSCFGVRWQEGKEKRLGIVVSRAIKTAVERNRIKRLIREVFRLNGEIFPQGDTIVIARGGLNELANQQIKTSLKTLLISK